MMSPEWLDLKKPLSEQEYPQGCILPRSCYQVFQFSFPELKNDELENALRYKLQTSTPLGLKNYEYFTNWERQDKKIEALVVLLDSDFAKSLAELISAKKVFLSFPKKLHKSCDEKTLLLVSVQDGFEIGVYENHRFKTSLPFVPGKLESPALLQILQNYEEYSQLNAEDLHLRDLIQLGIDNRKFKLFWVAPVLIVLGLSLTGIGIAHYMSERGQVINEWKIWVSSQQKSLLSRNQQAEVIHYKELQKRAGVSLLELSNRLSKVWSSGTKIQSIDLKGNKLTLEANSLSGLESLKKLAQDPWFVNFKQIQVRGSSSGQEDFILEGELNLEL